MALNQSLVPHQQYTLLLSSRPHLGPKGSSENGEIELITDEGQITEVVEASVQRLIKQGMPEETARKESQVGIITSDRYWMWVRDPVKFPSGALGTFNRIVPMCMVTLAHPGAAGLPVVVLPSTSLSSTSAVEVMVVAEEPKFVLLVTFRHATRSWEAEIPRGGPEGEHESVACTAVREVQEETGWHPPSSPPFPPKLLGYVNSDSGELTQTVPVFLVYVTPALTLLTSSTTTNNTTTTISAGVEFSEAINGCVVLTLTQVKEAIRSGQLPPPHVHVRVRDPYLAFALLQALLQGIF